jgi:DNA-binding transcriptional regulator YiaG
MHVSTAKAECPAAPPSRETTQARALHRACLVLGGAPQLAAHLGVGEATLQAWLEGRDEPPQMVFLAAVEIVLLHLEKSGTSN